MSASVADESPIFVEVRDPACLITAGGGAFLSAWPLPAEEWSRSNELEARGRRGQSASGRSGRTRAVSGQAWALTCLGQQKKKYRFRQLARAGSRTTYKVGLRKKLGFRPAIYI